MAYQNNAGLIANQNKEIRIMLMANLKAISTICEAGNEEFAKLILGEVDWNALKEKGLYKLAYDKTNEVFKQFGFPERSPQK